MKEIKEENFKHPQNDDTCAFVYPMLAFFFPPLWIPIFAWFFFVLVCTLNQKRHDRMC